MAQRNHSRHTRPRLPRPIRTSHNQTRAESQPACFKENNKYCQSQLIRRLKGPLLRRKM